MFYMGFKILENIPEHKKDWIFIFIYLNFGKSPKEIFFVWLLSMIHRRPFSLSQNPA